MTSETTWSSVELGTTAPRGSQVTNNTYLDILNQPFVYEDSDDEYDSSKYLQYEGWENYDYDNHNLIKESSSESSFHGNPFTWLRYELILSIACLLGVLGAVAYYEYIVNYNLLHTSKFKIDNWAQIDCEIVDTGVQYLGNCSPDSGPGSGTLRGNFDYGMCLTTPQEIGSNAHACQMDDTVKTVVQYLPSGTDPDSQDIPEVLGSKLEGVDVKPTFNTESHHADFSINSRLLMEVNTDSCTNVYLPWKKIQIGQGTRKVDRCAYEYGLKRFSMITMPSQVKRYLNEKDDGHCWIFEDDSCVVTTSNVKKHIFFAQFEQYLFLVFAFILLTSGTILCCLSGFLYWQGDVNPNLDPDWEESSFPILSGHGSARQIAPSSSYLA